MRQTVQTLPMLLAIMLDDIAQHFRLNSEYITVLAFAKYWVAKNKKSSGKDAKKEWGVTLKIRRLQIKVKPVMQKGERQDDFIEDDSEPSEVKQVVKSTRSAPVQRHVEVEEAEEEEEVVEEAEAEEVVEEAQEEEEDLEVTPVKPVKKQVDTKPKGKASGKATGKRTSKLEL
jgi:hypothetical protein